MVDIDVTANHVEKIARTYCGGAGPNGTDAEQFQKYVIKIWISQFLTS